MRSVALVVIACLGAVAARNAMAAERPSPPVSAQVEAGRAIYRHSCASCHGDRGQGARGWQKPDAQGELPAPPHDRTGHTWKHSDAMLYRLVQDGWRDPFNKTRRLTMPAFKGQLTRDETVAVIAYLKTLWTRRERAFQREESAHQPFPPGTP
ncbi:MAG: c-type cytochrome [Casimicrobiaceae bacterium]